MQLFWTFFLISLLTKLIRNKIGFYFLVFVPLVLVIFLEIADFVTQSKEEENEEQKNSNKPIKSLLLDQSILAGIGNIYADEICFACKISPTMKANNISLKKCI